MKAIRQTLKVKNRQVSITLPEDFFAEEVEVIVLSKEDDFVLSEEQEAILDERLQEPDENYISEEKSIKNLRKNMEIFEQLQ